MDKKFSVGDKIKLLRGDGPEEERGIVVHCWYDSQMQIFDYYVVVFGPSFPEGKPDRIPYVLRYAENALDKAE